MASEENDFIECAVCARNILRGERVTEYVTPEREVVAVCTLCKTRAEQMGWTQRSMAAEIRTDEPPRRRGFDLRGRLRGPRLARRGRGMTADELAREIGIPDREPEPVGEAGEPVEPRRRAVFDDEWDEPEPAEQPEPWADESASDFDSGFLDEPVSEREHEEEVDAAEPVREPGAADRAREEAEEPVAAADAEAPAGEAAADADGEGSPVAGAAARRIRRGTRRESGSQARRPARGAPEPEQPAAAVTPPRREPRTPARLMRTAAENFNASTESRKVSGLMRSLGEPHVSIRPPAREDLPALVTVAWELSWYQWEVGVELDDSSVREIAKGSEMSELDDAAQRWNARADEGGALRLRRAEPSESTQ